MQSFELERQIPPSEVTLDLLRQLEQFLLNDVGAKPAKEATEFDKAGYSVRISDSFGEETITSIEDFLPLLLPDTTSAVVVSYNSPYKASPHIRVSIAFRMTSYGSRFKIETNGESARETAVGIADRLHQVLAPQRRSHAFLHPSAAIQGMLAGATGATFFVGIVLLAGGNVVSGVATLAVSLMGTAYSSARSLRPYIIFDSQRSRAWGAIWNWFVGGLLTFVVFGTLLAALRHKIFGF